jgi:hypothetical protein
MFIFPIRLPAHPTSFAVQTGNASPPLIDAIRITTVVIPQILTNIIVTLAAGIAKIALYVTGHVSYRLNRIHTTKPFPIVAKVITTRTDGVTRATSHIASITQTALVMRLRAQMRNALPPPTDVMAIIIVGILQIPTSLIVTKPQKSSPSKIST